MYDELVERLHKRIALTTAGSPLQDDLKEAADAIEDLQKQVEHYHGGMNEWLAAYIAEHDKRIAENRYLYDELAKSVRAKLLMTPMRIEVPAPPKEE